MSVPTEADAVRIAALADPLVRNLQITQCYHELARAFAARSGRAANWCTFATWASRQAGQTIRREDLDRTFEHLLGTTPEVRAALNEALDVLLRIGLRRDPAAVRAAVRRALNPSAAFERAADAVARGNRKVFEEIGRAFACFLALEPGAEPFAAFCETLRPGDPPEGQRYLRQAFTRYVAALAEPDARRKAELLLLANLEIGFHEQTRLQPEIVEALTVPLPDPEEFKRCLVSAFFPGAGGLVLRLRLSFNRLLGRANPFDRAMDRLAEQARRLARLALTETAMTLALPGGKTLRLGQDVRGDFPENLRQIALADLQAMLGAVDPDPGSLRGSGAEDWGNLTDRMHFIADLFRSHHEVAALFDPPFSPDQVRVLKAGARL